MSLQERKKAAIAKKTANDIHKYERQDEVLAGRKRGQSFAVIAKGMGRSVSAVHQDYVRALERCAPLENIEEYRRLTALRLEGILEESLSTAELADSFKEWHGAIDVALKTTDRLIKITGLDKHEPESATRLDVTVSFEDVETGLMTLAKNGVIDVNSWSKSEPPEQKELD